MSKATEDEMGGTIYAPVEAVWYLPDVDGTPGGLVKRGGSFKMEIRRIHDLCETPARNLQHDILRPGFCRGNRLSVIIRPSRSSNKSRTRELIRIAKNLYRRARVDPVDWSWRVATTEQAEGSATRRRVFRRHRIN